MNFFKLKTTWSNAELIPLKLCIGSAFVLIGAYFHHFIATYKYFFLAIFFFTLIFSFGGWLRKMRNENKSM